MSDEITYMKANPSEVIIVGDIIMLDHSTGRITKAVNEKKPGMNINSRLVVGVCVWSDNDTPLNLIIDGGSCKEADRITLENMSPDVETIIIYGGDSTQNTRNIIQVAYTGQQIVNVCGPVHIGDRLCISNLPGVAKSKDFIGRQYEDLRSIGKVVKLDKNNKKAKVLLDIE